MKTRNIPITDLELLEKARKDIWKIFGDDMDKIEEVGLVNITNIIYKIANYDYPEYNQESEKC